MRIAIIGRTQILYETALKLHEAGHQIACIITAKAAPEYTRKENDFKDLARKFNAPFVLTDTLDKPEITKLCSGLDIGVSINWVSVITQQQIDLFRLGILNSHHADLPRFRGNACSNWAIINDEEKITNTIHFMVGGELDCGRVICQEHFHLSKEATITDVYKWAEVATPALYVQALDLIDKDNDFSLKMTGPNGPGSFRCYPRLPEDNFINWELPVAKVHNLIRAVCFPFSGAYTYHRHQGEVKKLIVLKSRIVQAETKDLAVPGHVLENNKVTGESFVRCGDGIIALLKCRYEDQQEEFFPGKTWKSIRMRLGIRVEDWFWGIYKENK